MEDLLTFVVVPLLVAITILLFVIANKLTNGRCWEITKWIVGIALWVTIIGGSVLWYVSRVGQDKFLDELADLAVFVIAVYALVRFVRWLPSAVATGRVLGQVCRKTVAFMRRGIKGSHET